MFKVITGTLQANHNTMQLTDDTITNDSIFEVYADTENVIPSSVSVGGHTVTVTFDSKPSNNVGIKVLINNIVGEFAPSDVYADDVIYTNPLMQTDNVKDTLDIVVNRVIDIGSDLDNIDTELHTDTVLGGVLYHATTGNTWKKLDASNLDYDSEITIYSAMGNIDELTTESKNIVDAINEINDAPSGGYDITTTEVKTGKKIFGKDIYTKAYSYYGTINTSGTNIGSNVITNLDDIENLTNAYIIRTDTRAFTPIACYVASQGSINMRCMFSISQVNNLYIILEYTKVGV